MIQKGILWVSFSKYAGCLQQWSHVANLQQPDLLKDRLDCRWYKTCNMAFQFYFMQLCKTSCSFSHSFKATKRTLLTDDWRARYMSVCCPRAPRRLARQTGKTVPENIRDWNKQKQIKYLRSSLRISCVSQRSKASFLKLRPQGFSVKKMRKMHLIWVSMYLARKC